MSWRLSDSNEPPHKAVKVAQRLHAGKLLVGDADLQLFFEVADEFYKSDRIKAKVRDHCRFIEVFEPLSADFKCRLTEKRVEIEMQHHRILLGIELGARRTVQRRISAKAPASREAVEVFLSRARATVLAVCGFRK